MKMVVRRGREVRAQRGTTLRCKGWRQEAILRLLENNIENAEDPENLIIYMSVARAARDWTSFDRIVATLMAMSEDQTLVVQSGKPVAVFPGQATTPIVIMANGNIVGQWNTEENRQRLDDAGLTIYPGMTAAAWQYIGSQGILQGTYETFSAIGRQHFGGDLAGRLLLTSGCGGMGGAQPLAGKMAGAATLVLDVDEERILRRISGGYCDMLATSLDEAVAIWTAAAKEKRPIAIALCANAAEVLPQILQRGIVPDIVTDQTTTDPLKGYYPPGLSLDETRRLRQSEPDRIVALARKALVKHIEAMMGFRKAGAIVFEYGNNLQLQSERAGFDNAFEMKSFVDLYIRPLFCAGTGPFRWIAVSGEPDDIYKIDDIILKEFPASHPICFWISKAKESVKFSGLPARIGWLGFRERSRLALLVNEAVKTKHLSGPLRSHAIILIRDRPRCPFGKQKICETARTLSLIGQF